MRKSGLKYQSAVKHSEGTNRIVSMQQFKKQFVGNLPPKV
jgi:hypothetical protein